MSYYITPAVILTGYKVKYVDMREAKPRTVRTETFVLDACTIGALGRTGQAVPDFIRRRYEMGGYLVFSIEREGSRRQATLDLQALWRSAQ